MRSRVSCLALVGLLISVPPAAPSEEESVLAVVQGLFDAMAARDPSAGRPLVIQEGHLFRVREDGSVAQMTHDAFLRRLEAETDEILERMWNADVRVHQAIATVWAPYDFYRNGKLSHCGVDAFSLLKTPEGWKIASVVYTVETECTPSPLGPPSGP